MRSRTFVIMVWLLVMGGVADVARGVWFDESWPYRRAVNVTWDAEHATGREVAQVTILTAGHHLRDGSDVRVLTYDGRPVAFEVMRVGPGDQVEVAFGLHRQSKDYYVYWGRSQPPPLPADQPKFAPTSGLLMEVRQWNTRRANNFQQIMQSFDASQSVLGKTMIDQPLLSYNPVADQRQSISKITGTILAPIDGSYYFAINADDRAGLWIDGQPVAFASHIAGDARFNGTIDLTRGQHDFTVYLANFGGDCRLNVGWRTPGTAKMQTMERGAFGYIFGGVIGPMEQTGKRLVADFQPQYMGECFFSNEYAHRIRFTAAEVRGGEYEWSFGDGQTARGQQVDHVYLTGGVFPVKITVKTKEAQDTQTTELQVQRDFSNLRRMKEDGVITIAPIVRGYDLSGAPPDQLIRMIELQQQAGDRQAMLAAAMPLARLVKQPTIAKALAALQLAVDDALSAGMTDQAIALLEQVPENSNLQPRAAVILGESLLWWGGDAQKAANVLQPYKKNAAVQRTLGQALILSGHKQEGLSLLQSLPVTVEQAKQAAVSGALARTVEFYIDQKEVDAGETSWQQWMQQFPADFVEGYSLLLRVRLMELRGLLSQAATIAQSFATAVPDSPYAPRLLDTASRLLKSTDPDRSAALHQLLKQRYPEDPLSQ